MMLVIPLYCCRTDVWDKTYHQRLIHERIVLVCEVMEGMVIQGSQGSYLFLNRCYVFWSRGK
jgi:hypothetical protein